jgi:hypothetical protein
MRVLEINLALAKSSIGNQVTSPHPNFFGQKIYRPFSLLPSTFPAFGEQMFLVVVVAPAHLRVV